jgi:hypothetical protein
MLCIWCGNTATKVFRSLRARGARGAAAALLAVLVFVGVSADAGQRVPFRSFPCKEYSQLSTLQNIMDTTSMEIGAWIEGYLVGIGKADVYDDQRFWGALHDYCDQHPAVVVKAAVDVVLKQRR